MVLIIIRPVIGETLAGQVCRPCNQVQILRLEGND